MVASHVCFFGCLIRYLLFESLSFSGYVTIPLCEISGRNEVQTWLTLQPPADPSSQDDFSIDIIGAACSDSTNSLTKNLRNAKSSIQLMSSNSSILSSNQTNGDLLNSPQLRIRARYQSIEVLPLSYYWPLRTVSLFSKLSKRLNTVKEIWLYLPSDARINTFHLCGVQHFMLILCVFIINSSLVDEVIIC